MPYAVTAFIFTHTRLWTQKDAKGEVEKDIDNPEFSHSFTFI